MNAGENKPTGLVKDMDTSILNTLSLIAPDLMEEMELRALILERVAWMDRVGLRQWNNNGYLVGYQKFPSVAEPFW